jgi:hypothetical protein
VCGTENQPVNQRSLQVTGKMVSRPIQFSFMIQVEGKKAAMHSVACAVPCG